MYKSREYVPIAEEGYRPNTRKLYEDHYDILLPGDYAVHHVLPVRLGGTHEIGNLTVLHNIDHAQAHLDLYEKFGDPKDLCAYYMISGHTEASRLVACAMGGRASQIAKKERGDLNGFQLFSPERRKEIAAKAGSIGGNKQRELGLGIHIDSETRNEWSRLGGKASIEVNGFNDPARQSERGKVGGLKNAGSRWYNDGVTLFKYTSDQQIVESFEDFITRTNMKKGKVKK